MQPSKDAPNAAATGSSCRPVSCRRMSARAQEFRKRFFPAARARDWQDWRWQMRQRIHDLPTLERILTLSSDERGAVLRHQGTLPVGITPYYASLLDPDNPLQPLRRSVVPVNDEYIRLPGETTDPLAED